MNFLQLVQRLRQETNYVNAGPSTVSGQIGDHARAVSWIADAYTDLQRRHNWRWLRKEFTLTTTSGVDTYDYTSAIDTPTAAAISRFKDWRLTDRRNPPRCYLSSSGSGAEYWLSYLPWDVFSRLYYIGDRSDSAPTHITVDPDNNIVLGPQPDDEYVITGDYHRSAQVLTADEDEPEMPSDYHMAIVYLAMEDFGYYDVSEEVITRGRNKGRRLIRQLEIRQLDKPRMAGPLA